MHLKRVVRAKHRECIVRPSEVYSTLVDRKREVFIIPKVRDYTIPVICKNSLINFSNVSNLTLVVSKCSNVIPCKFKVVKFMIE